MRLAQTIKHEAFDGSQRDSRGNVIEAWKPAVDVAVFGWHTGKSAEPQIPGHERVTVDGQVFAPESWKPQPRDRVILPGAGRFEVQGFPEDYNHGPFGYRPGVAVNLRQVSG